MNALKDINNLKKWKMLTKPINYQPRIHLPIEMREILKQKALENGRTYNNEVLERLTRTLYEEENEIVINK